VIINNVSANAVLDARRLLEHSCQSFPTAQVGGKARTPSATCMPVGSCGQLSHVSLFSLLRLALSVSWHAAKLRWCSHSGVEEFAKQQCLRAADYLLSPPDHGPTHHLMSCMPRCREGRRR
jgi:hypothetical protein